MKSHVFSNVAYFKSASVGIEEASVLVSEQAFQVPAGRRYGSRAAEHTSHSGGTALGQIAEGIFCRSFTPARFPLHCLHSAYHVQIWDFISHENVPYIFMP